MIESNIQTLYLWTFQHLYLEIKSTASFKYFPVAIQHHIALSKHHFHASTHLQILQVLGFREFLHVTVQHLKFLHCMVTQVMYM